MNIIFLDIFLTIMLLGNYFFSNKILINPSLIFNASMLLSALFATLLCNKLRIDVSITTVIIICTGTFIFFCVSLFIDSLTNEVTTSSIFTLKVEKVIFIVFILFQVIVYYLYAREITKVMGYPMSRFNEAAVLFRDNSMFSKNFRYDFSSIISNLKMLTDAAVIWFSYILVNNKFTQKKASKYLYLIIILGILFSVSLGGRTGAINQILIFVFLFLFYFYKNGIFKNKLNLKYLVFILVIFTLIIFSFQMFVTLIGRASWDNLNALEYVAVYVGAPLINLSSFISDGITNTSGLKFQTFVNIQNNLIGYFNLNRVMLDLPFRFKNSLQLGNVYTFFYPLLYDFGYFGTIIFTFFISICSQIFFKISKFSSSKKGVPITELIFIYILCSLALSFFSNRFVENILNLTFLKYIVVWILMNNILLKSNTSIKGK